MSKQDEIEKVLNDYLHIGKGVTHKEPNECQN